MNIKKDIITIVGNGNVGSHLATNLLNQQIEVNIIANKSFDYSSLKDDHLILICVPDDQIENVVKKLNPNCFVAYTSGSKEISSLPVRKNIGVFYPLQTFTKDSELELQEIPFLIEANTEQFSNHLYELASKLSSNVVFANHAVRKELHISAVFVNNFTNHILFLAENHALNKGVDFELLKPLMHETIKKLKHQSPFYAQTGPAKRGDVNTINQHIDSLEGNEREVYEVLTRSIINTYKKNDKL